MMTEFERRARMYIDVLGIRWQVSFQRADVTGPAIKVDRERQIHFILFPDHPAYVLREVDVAHELGHAFLAERVDPILSSIYLVDGTDMKDPRVDMLDISQEITDVWVGDVLYRVNHTLIPEEVRSWLDRVNDERIVLSDSIRYLTLASYALNHAHITRMGLKGFTPLQGKAMKRIRQFYGEDSGRTARRLAEFYAELPQLPMQRDRALPLFERSVQSAVQIFGFPIRPRIIEEDGMAKWRVE